MKTYRVYFNRRSEAPQVWSVDEGTQASEINVQWVSFDGVSINSYFNPAVTREQAEFEPSAWLQLFANAHFECGGVRFSL
jgi:hypothetical protein